MQGQGLINVNMVPFNRIRNLDTGHIFQHFRQDSDITAYARIKSIDMIDWTDKNFFCGGSLGKLALYVNPNSTSWCCGGNLLA